jgi:DNA (cytosine-5)-methyltransferase 1
MKKSSQNSAIRFIDLFAGIGGFRLGFENACDALGIKHECVFTSEIKQHAVAIYQENFSGTITGDITKVEAHEVPDFDVLLGGFPCQAFSSAGKREGFADTRGTLFFEIERIIRAKKPKAIILENVEGLVNHDRLSKSDEIGRTLSTILQSLKSLDYEVTWAVLNANDFGIPQRRKRIYIVASLTKEVSLKNFETNHRALEQILQTGIPPLDSKLARLLNQNFSPSELYGKAIKDKRGGEGNIHSWDLGLKGKVSKKQKELLQRILKARRNKKWAAQKGIEWMDGMPLTLDEIQTFFNEPKLLEMLEDLVEKGYLAYEHPKGLVTSNTDGNVKTYRTANIDSPKGYNIVSGKLSFEINMILDPKGSCPTLVATDLSRITVCDSQGVRGLTNVELRRLFGFPDDFKILGKQSEVNDVFGNTVVVPVVQAVSERVIDWLVNKNDHSDSVHSLGDENPPRLFN